MKRFGNYLFTAALVAIVLGSALGNAAAASVEEFTAAIERIKTYDYSQSRDLLSAVSGMVNAVGEHPVERKLFAAKMAALLGSDASDPCKVFLCRQLAIIGTEDQVASLSPLLVEEKYSDMARYALERISGEKTCAAMRAALANASGRAQIGLLNSLGVLGDEQAVPPLAGLANGPEATVAAAAVAALGKIGGPQAERVLKTLSLTAKDQFLNEVYDAYLGCADKLAAGNKRSQALAVYSMVYSNCSSFYIRSVALRGMVTASENSAATVILTVLEGDDQAMQAVAVSQAGEIPGQKATTAFAQMLPRLSPEMQVKLLAVLGYRGDRAALPEVLKALKSEDEFVRVAALNTLGDIGDASTVSLLAQTAAQGLNASSQSARKSLYQLQGGGVDPEIMNLLAKSDPKVEVELIKAVAQRKIASAVPTLLKSATNADSEIRQTSLKALCEVAEGESMPALVDLLVNAQTDADRTEAENTVVAVAGKASRGPNPSQPILALYPSARDSVIKVSLIKVLGDIGDDSSLSLLEKALAEPDKEISHAAARALSAWPNPGPLSALQKCEQTTDDNLTRTLALRGWIRLIGLDKGRDAAQTLALYGEAMKRSIEAFEKKAVLAGLAEVRTRDSLKMTAAYLEDESLKSEAALAVSRIACPLNDQDNGLRGSDVINALKKAAVAIGETSERKKVEDYLSTMPEDEEGFVSMFNGKDLDGWQGGDFVVADGVMICHGHNGGGLTYTKSQFTNFVMRFELKLTPSANNGLNFRSRNSRWNEIQILDDAHPVYTNLHPYQTHGSLYGVVSAKRGFLKPAGHWNYEEVVADGPHIRVTLNGTVILDADLNKLDLDHCLDGTAHPGLRDASGDLGWLGHLNGYEQPGDVFFRNIRIKTLP